MKSPGIKLFLMKQDKGGGGGGRIKKTKDTNHVCQFWCVPYGFNGIFLKLCMQTADQIPYFMTFICSHQGKWV